MSVYQRQSLRCMNGKIPVKEDSCRDPDCDAFFSQMGRIFTPNRETLISRRNKRGICREARRPTVSRLKNQCVDGVTGRFPFSSMPSSWSNWS